MEKKQKKNHNDKHRINPDFILKIMYEKIPDSGISKIVERELKKK